MKNNNNNNLLVRAIIKIVDITILRKVSLINSHARQFVVTVHFILLFLHLINVDDENDDNVQGQCRRFGQ